MYEDAMPKSTMSGRLRVGKVPPAGLLRSVFPYLGLKDRRLLIGPGIGRDVAAVDYGERVLVFSTDPITGTVTRIGRHSVQINANDIATAGARPKWYLCTILLPPKTSEEALRQIMGEMNKATRGLGIALVGGHTEVTPGLTRPIIVGFMVGETTRERLLSADGGRAGDRVLLTKTAGLEGTAILAYEYEDKLRGLKPEIVHRAKKLLDQISVVKEALSASRVKGVHAMHDPTEGGVLNGLWELAEASGLGIMVDAAGIPVSEETRAVCRALRLDPLKLMSSGSLLVSSDPARFKIVSRALARTGVSVSEVARLTTASRGRVLVRGSRLTRLDAVPTDELHRLA